MRMHRGSSKGGRPRSRPPEILPLSASPDGIPLDLEIARAGRSQRSSVRVARGTHVRDAIRAVAGSPEGCAVLLDGVPIPLDLPVDRPMSLVIVPTFSGG